MTFVLALAVAGCGSPGLSREGDPALDVVLRVSPTPPMAGLATVAIRATDGGAPLPKGARIIVTALGGASSPEVELEFREPGRWEGPLAFPQAGVATVAVAVSTPDRRTATFRIPVTVARRPDG